MRLSRVQSSLSQHSQSASQSRAQSRSGSSASSPRLQIRGRTLPQDDALPPDLRLDTQLRRSSHQRSSPALPDPQNDISSLQANSAPPADLPYYQRPLVPPLQDMPPRYTHHLVPQYALNPQFSSNHVPGHVSPPYMPPHSGQGTPPYPHYPAYPAYMYGHPSLFWGDAPPPHSHTHFQNQHLIPSSYINASEHAVPQTTELASTSPAITTEPGASKHAAQGTNGWQSRPSKNVIFGTINLAESPTGSSASLPGGEQPTDAAAEHATEQFATFSIGVSPNERTSSRLGSRKPLVRSLSGTPVSQPATNDSARDANVAPSSSQVNGIKKSIKWEFGTTQNEDLDDSRPSSPPSPPPPPPPNPQGESSSDNVDDQPGLVNASPSLDTAHTSQADRSIDKSGTDSSASDVWEVKNYGYGFGDRSGQGNTPDVVRLEMREREKERTRGLVQHRDRSWVPGRQPGWRSENGNEDGREGWEQQGHTDAPRHVRPRRGSFPGYGGHERGGYAARRGRGFGGRSYGARGRGGFYHYQRPGSYAYAPPLPPPPPPPPPPPSLQFEVLPPAIDMTNGYGQPPYAMPEFESYEAIPPAPHRAPFTSASYSVDAMQNCLLSQLEYYLSPQNMAQDLFLRQRVSPRPSPLLQLVILLLYPRLTLCVSCCRWTTRAGFPSHCWRRLNGCNSCTRARISSRRF